MKKIVSIIAFISICFCSFSQIIEYESTEWDLIEYVANTDAEKKRTEIQDSCRICFSSYCENATNAFWIDLKYDNNWHIVFGSIDKVDKDDRGTSYQIKFSPSSDLIKGCDFSNEVSVMGFMGKKAVILGNKYGIVLKNTTVKIEH